MKKAVLYQSLSQQMVRCQACSWYCQIAPNYTGVCATRANLKGRLYSLVYGKAIGLHLDPVEKKPLFHFLPDSTIYSFGTAGCNFGCLFCQNWEMSQLNKNEKIIKKLTQLIDSMSTTITPKKIVEEAVNAGAAGIAYTYNEPAIFIEFAADTAKLARKHGLKNIFVSNGFESKETFEYIKDYLDAINIDLKSIKPQFYQTICKAKIGPVMENINRYFQHGIEIEVTTLVIPGKNDSHKELTAIANFLVSVSPDLPWHLSAFYPAYQMIDVPPTPMQTLVSAYAIGKQAGLRYVYLGNVLDAIRSSTYCPKCNNLLIYRQGYQVQVKNLDTRNGVCSRCQTKIYGIWH